MLEAHPCRGCWHCRLFVVTKYAYETAAGVRIAEQAMATRDVDMLFDTRKRLAC